MLRIINLPPSITCVSKRQKENLFYYANGLCARRKTRPTPFESQFSEAYWISQGMMLYKNILNQFICKEAVVSITGSCGVTSIRLHSVNILVYKISTYSARQFHFKIETFSLSQQTINQRDPIPVWIKRLSSSVGRWCIPWRKLTRDFHSVVIFFWCRILCEWAQYSHSILFFLLGSWYWCVLCLYHS